MDDVELAFPRWDHLEEQIQIVRVSISIESCQNRLEYNGYFKGNSRIVVNSTILSSTGTALRGG